jgi:hypothetical protein
VLVVVYDADAASAEDLDTLRMAWEEGCDSMSRVRIILLGSHALAATLATDEARAFASRVGSTIRVASAKSRRVRIALPEMRRPSLAQTGAAVGLASLLAFVSLDAPSAAASGAGVFASPFAVAAAWLDSRSQPMLASVSAFVTHVLVVEPAPSAASFAKANPSRTPTAANFAAAARARRAAASPARASKPAGERVRAWYTIRQTVSDPTISVSRPSRDENRISTAEQ